MEFAEIAQERYDRQGQRCAGCRKILVRENYSHGDRGAWEAHHIDGEPTNDTLYNCACLCINEPENCHLKLAHLGNFDGNEIAHRSAFTLGD